MQHQRPMQRRQSLNISWRNLTSSTKGINQHGHPVLAEERHNRNNSSNATHGYNNQENGNCWKWIIIPIVLTILKWLLSHTSNLLYIYITIRWIKCPVLSWPSCCETCSISCSILCKGVQTAGQIDTYQWQCTCPSAFTLPLVKWPSGYKLR